MGGIQVVFCGDFFQLPPVTKASSTSSVFSFAGWQQPVVNASNAISQLPPAASQLQSNTNNVASIGTAVGTINANSSTRFCFQSPLWERLIEESFDLEQVYRQNGDAQFVSVLNSIRVGQFTDQCRQLLGGCVGRKLDCSDGILPTQIFTHK